MNKTFEEYFSGVKGLRTEDNYNYSNEQLEKYIKYFKDCYRQNISCYKALEWLYFEINYRDDIL